MKKILKDILDWITGASAKVKTVLGISKDYANEIKGVLNSPLLTAIVKATPTDLDDKALEVLRSGLAAFIVIMGWADRFLSEFDKDPDARAAVLTVINAKSAVLIGEIKGADITMQQALASAPVVYEPNLVA